MFKGVGMPAAQIVGTIPKDVFRPIVDNHGGLHRLGTDPQVELS